MAATKVPAFYENEASTYPSFALEEALDLRNHDLVLGIFWACMVADTSKSQIEMEFHGLAAYSMFDIGSPQQNINSPPPDYCICKAGAANGTGSKGPSLMGLKHLTGCRSGYSSIEPVCLWCRCQLAMAQWLMDWVMGVMQKGVCARNLGIWLQQREI